MAWPFNRKRFLSLTGDSRSTMLAEVARTSAGDARLRLLARTDNALSEDVALPRLLATAGNIRGRISLTLPLVFFEIVVVNLPLISDAAVSKTLPYHLGKTLRKPLNEFIYDWQITGRFKDRLQVTVYLFSAPLFQKIRRELIRQQLEVAYFEPDVYAAFALLAHRKMLPAQEATLCVLLWPDSFSLAVHEKGAIPLSRTVRALQPHGEIAAAPAAGQATTAAANPQADDIFLAEEEKTPDQTDQFDTEAILANFCVLPSDMAQQPTPETAVPPSAGWEPPEGIASAPSASAAWPEYWQQVTLEMLRTRDYYATIQKGAPIRNVYIGGADAFWLELSARAADTLGLPCCTMGGPAGSSGPSSLLEMLAIGTGVRW